MKVYSSIPTAAAALSLALISVKGFAPTHVSLQTHSITSQLNPQKMNSASDNESVDKRTNTNNPLIDCPLTKPLATAITIFSLAVATLSTNAQPTQAADYGAFTDEQRFIAEAWRTVDSAYIDRTFNSQNWFQMRQDALKKKYKNMNEAQAEVEKMLSSLGDRYTRYLPPSKYESIVNAATGNVYGVGVELAQSGDRVIASDVEPNSPASRGGLERNDVFCMMVRAT